MVWWRRQKFVHLVCCCTLSNRGPSPPNCQLKVRCVLLLGSISIECTQCIRHFWHKIYPDNRQNQQVCCNNWQTRLFGRQPTTDSFGETGQQAKGRWSSWEHFKGSCSWRRCKLSYKYLNPTARLKKSTSLWNISPLIMLCPPPRSLWCEFLVSAYKFQLLGNCLENWQFWTKGSFGTHNAVEYS